MELPTLLDARAWRHRLCEWSWKAFPGKPLEPVTLSWPLADDASRRIRVRWPRQYQWAPRGIIGEQVLAALQRHVPCVREDIPQPHQGCIVAEVDIDGKRRRIIFETSDYAALNEDAYADCDLHFKMEFSLDGYGDRDHLVPAGYVSADAALYRYLPRLRRLRDETKPRWEVYGRYGLSLEKRRRPLEILRGAASFQFYGGEGKVRYSAYLEEVARSKICIDLPSMSSITFRCIDLLAVGSCIVGPPHTNRLLGTLTDGVHVAYCRPDYADLEDVCAALLRDEERRRSLVANSRRFFDAYVHRDQQASWWVNQMLARLA